MLHKVSGNIIQELVPDNVLPNDFVQAIKNSDYSSVSYFSNLFHLFFFILYGYGYFLPCVYAYNYENLCYQDHTLDL